MKASRCLPGNPKRGRLWLNDGSCVRLRPEKANHVWAYDFVEDPAANPPGFGEHPGQAQDPAAELAEIPQGFAAGVDEFTRECLTIRVARKLGSADVIDVLADPAANPCGVSASSSPVARQAISDRTTDLNS